MLISFCKVDHVIQMGTTSLKEPHHHLVLKRRVTTGLHSRAKISLKLWISWTEERRCHKEILMNSSNYGIFHLWSMGVPAHLEAINTFTIQSMQLRMVGIFSSWTQDENKLIYWMLQVMHHGSVSRLVLLMTWERMHQTGNSKSMRSGSTIQMLSSEISLQTQISITSLTQRHMWRSIGMDSGDGLISCQLIMYGITV